MKFGDALKLFAGKKFKPIILFCGEEEYLKSEGIRALLDALDIGTPELNISCFEERPDTSAVATAIETLPFMSEKRVVLIKNTDILVTTSAAELTASAAELTNRLEKARIPKSNFVIISTKGKTDKRRAFYKKIAKDGIVVDCNVFSDAEIADYAVSLAFKNGRILSKSNAQQMIEYCGNDLSTVVNEIGKLSSVCVGNISKQDIEKYVSKSAQYSIFKIHDFLCAGKLLEAKALIDRTLLDEPNPIGLISIISNNFKQMLVARACRDAKLPPGKVVLHIMEQTNAKDWVAKRVMANSNLYTAAQLRRGIYALGRVDFMAKQGEVVLKTDIFPILADIYSK